jgi:hypothetical protein
MNRPRHELLAASRLSHNQDAEGGRRHEGYLFQDLLDGRAWTHLNCQLVGVVPVDAPAKIFDLEVERPRLERPSNDGHDVVIFDRLGEVVERPQLRRANRCLDVARGGQHHHGQ